MKKKPNFHHVLVRIWTCYITRLMSYGICWRVNLVFTMGFFLPSCGKGRNLIEIDSSTHELCVFNFYILSINISQTCMTILNAEDFFHPKISIIITAYLFDFTCNFCINLIGPHLVDRCVRDRDQFLSEWDVFNSVTRSTVE